MNTKAKSNIQSQKELRQRVIALLTRQEIEFLDKLGMDALFSCGYKLTHTKLISYVIDILIRLGIDGKGIKDSYDLERKIKNAFIKILVAQPLLPREEAPINPSQVRHVNIEKKDEKK